jgi:hypothetical protein
MFDLFEDDVTVIEIQFRKRADRSVYDMSGLDGAIIGWRFNEDIRRSDLMATLDAEQGRAEFTWGGTNSFDFLPNVLLSGKLHLEFFLIEGTDFIGSNTYILDVNHTL